MNCLYHGALLWLWMDTFVWMLVLLKPLLSNLGIIRRWVNNYPQYRYNLYFNKKKKTYTNIIFQHSPLAFQCTSSIVAQASLCPQKKNVLAEQPATHAPLPSSLGLRWINGPLMPPWVDQTGDSLMGRDRDYTEDEPMPLKLEFLECFNCVGSSMRLGIVMQQYNAFRQLSSAFASNFRLQPVNKHLTVMSIVYCWTPLQIMFQYWALWVPKNCKHQFLCSWLAFELFPDGRLWMFPFYNLPLTFRLVMVDPCFVISDDSVQEGVTFFIIAIQILLADVQARLLMQYCELFWDPSCTNFMKAKSIVHDFIGRKITNLQTICHFINSHSSNNHVTYALNGVVRCGRGRASGSFIPNNCVIIFEFTKTKLNSMALVRTRTIPTERPPPVGEVGANVCG